MQAIVMAASLPTVTVPVRVLAPTSRPGEWSYPFATAQDVANGLSRNVNTDTESASRTCAFIVL